MQKARSSSTTAAKAALLLPFQSSHAYSFLALFVFQVSPFKPFLPSPGVKLQKRNPRLFSHLQMSFSLVILIFTMRSRQWHTGMQIPAALNTVLQSQIWTLSVCQMLLPETKSSSSKWLLQAFLVEKLLHYKLGSHLEQLFWDKKKSAPGKGNTPKTSCQPPGTLLLLLLIVRGRFAAVDNS